MIPLQKKYYKTVTNPHINLNFLRNFNKVCISSEVKRFHSLIYLPAWRGVDILISN